MLKRGVPKGTWFMALFLQPFIAAMIACVKKMGATTAKLVQYENSGKATGDYRSVVGYAGLTFK